MNMQTVLGLLSVTFALTASHPPSPPYVTKEINTDMKNNHESDYHPPSKSVQSLLSTPEFWKEITLLHNSKAFNVEDTPTIAQVDYEQGRYNDDNIYSLILKSLNLTQQMIHQSSNQSSLLTPLANKLLQKCTLGQTTAESCSLHVAIFGGSVTYGSACSTIQEYCAWPHRFVHFATKSFQHLFNNSPGEDPLFSISPRYCAVGGRSSGYGLNLLKSRQYKECYMNVSVPYTSQQYDATWEPDLIIWDYSVNDQTEEAAYFIEMYENFIYYALHHLPSQPQVIASEFMGSSNGNFHYLPPLLRARILHRQEVNARYHIPSLNYPGLFPSYFTPRDTVYMAGTNKATPHPLWPTHVLWGHMMTSFLLFHLDQLDLRNRTTLFPVPAWGGSNTTHAHHHERRRGFCSTGYAAYIDFAFTKVVLPNNVMLEHSEGWQLISDSTAFATRKGFIFSTEVSQKQLIHGAKPGLEVQKPHQKHIPTKTKPNFFQFTCLPSRRTSPVLPLSGMVTIGYMQSYGAMWANAMVQFKYFCVQPLGLRNETKVMTVPSITLQSNTKKNISVLKEFQYIPTQFTNTNTICPFESELHRVQIVIRVLAKKHSKFKLLALGCC